MELVYGGEHSSFTTFRAKKFSSISLVLDRELTGVSNPLPLHPLIHHQGHAALEPHSGPGRNGFDLGDI